MATEICDDCGLPVEVCNALTLYRLAAKSWKNGDRITAESYEKSAIDSYEKYRATMRTT
jgi:hypothetical protein